MGDRKVGIVVESKPAVVMNVAIQETLNALNDIKIKHKEVVKEFNNLVTEHNNTVDKIGALIGFMQIQCGVLYTAITGDTQVDDPMKEISPILLKTDADQDLNFFRKGIIEYVETFTKTGDPKEAYAAYQLHIIGGK